MNVTAQVVCGRCPICAVVLPFGIVKAVRSHWWKVKVNVTLDFDYTDYIAHVWTHERNQP